MASWLVDGSMNIFLFSGHRILSLQIPLYVFVNEHVEVRG